MPPEARDAESGGRQARPLHYVRFALKLGDAVPLPELEEALSAGYSIGFTLIRVRGGDVAWRDDGLAPTVDEGMPVGHGGEEPYDGDPSNLCFIALSGAPVLHVTYYARP